MGKIRVQDLAHMMGVANQDLLFKLKSIGVRVEGEDAHIDTDVIAAILQGKKLPQPREVILRDREEEQPAPRPSRRPPTRPQPAPLRSARRTMIQRVDSKIRTIEIKDRPPHLPDDVDFELGEEHTGEVQDREVVAVEAPPAATAPTQAAAAEPQVEPPPPTEAEPKVEAPSKQAAPEAPAPAQPPKAAKAEAPAKAAAPTKATAAAKAEAPAKPAKPQTAAQRLHSKSLEPRARIISKPTEPYKGVPDRPAPTDRWQRPAPPGGPGPTGQDGRKDQRRRPGPRTRRDGGADRSRSAHSPRRGAATRGVPVEPLLPVSDRGRRRAKRREDASGKPREIMTFREERPDGQVTISEGLTVRDFAEKLGVKAKDLIKALVNRGIMATINHLLDPETAIELGLELGIDVVQVSFEEEVQLRHETELAESPEGVERVQRAPVVTVMGHVDHGKTTLLDVIRSTDVAGGEAGGITQHIGAYRVEVGGRPIVFLDTPGHEAFTLMRARGARVTDIVVLVVAADDGVMPQTIEAIDHAKAAGVPIVIAVNKVDKANANPDRVKKDLADHGLMVEEWGGSTVSVPLSALKREGIPELLEMILLTADILELKAAPELPAQGTVLEARKDIGRGIVATVLVEDGTLRIGDMFVAGSTWGRVRSMINDHGERLEEAPPSTPVEVTGFNDLPSAGDSIQVAEDEPKARSIADYRRREDRDRELAPGPQRLSLLELFNQIEQGETKELSIVIKADVTGSIEVLKEALPKLSTEKVKIRIIHSSVGAISTNDVLLASASKALIVGFNVRPERNAATLAEKEGVELRLHTVIYELADELRRAMTGLLEPVYNEVSKGRAEVRDTFKVPKVGVIAGSHVTEGVIPRSAQVRLLRDNRVVYEGKISSLRRFKEDVSEVRSGFDCGIGLHNFQDVKPGDQIEAYAREEVEPTL